MHIQNYLLDATDVVLAWDLPEESLSDAVHVQACLMARISPEEIRGVSLD